LCDCGSQTFKTPGLKENVSNLYVFTTTVIHSDEKYIDIVHVPDYTCTVNFQLWAVCSSRAISWKKITLSVSVITHIATAQLAHLMCQEPQLPLRNLY